MDLVFSTQDTSPHHISSKLKSHADYADSSLDLVLELKSGLSMGKIFTIVMTYATPFFVLRKVYALPAYHSLC